MVSALHLALDRMSSTGPSLARNYGQEYANENEKKNEKGDNLQAAWPGAGLKIWRPTNQSQITIPQVNYTQN